MDSFVFWSDKPFDPRLVSRRRRHRARTVTIRYRGSLGRSAVKALIVLALLAVMSNVIGERTTQSLDANEVAAEVGSASTPR
jgi:hypothetical protein